MRPGSGGYPRHRARPTPSPEDGREAGADTLASKPGARGRRWAPRVGQMMLSSASGQPASRRPAHGDRDIRGPGGCISRTHGSDAPTETPSREVQGLPDTAAAWTARSAPALTPTSRRLWASIFARTFDPSAEDRKPPPVTDRHIRCAAGRCPPHVLGRPFGDARRSPGAPRAIVLVQFAIKSILGSLTAP